jgi:hypothetical protein
MVVVMAKGSRTPETTTTFLKVGAAVEKRAFLVKREPEERRTVDENDMVLKRSVSAGRLEGGLFWQLLAAGTRLEDL